MSTTTAIICAVGLMMAMAALFSIPRGSNARDIEQTATVVIPEWKPRKREFTLDDGTRCVAVSTRATNFPTSAGFSGISCDWKNKEGM